MKKPHMTALAGLCILLAGWSSAFAQPNYVTIPDANFRAKLKVQYPTCFNELDQMDANCPAVVDATVLEVGSSNIADLSGLEHFPNLTALEIWRNRLTALPPLPPKLEKLNCQENQLSTLPALPATVREINAYGNRFTELPSLPSVLLRLDVTQCQLSSLPPLPEGLQICYIGYNPLTVLPTLPSSLRALSLAGLGLTNMPSLPSGLTYLNCDNNLLTNLPSLPSVEELHCEYNLLTSLPAMPSLWLGLQANNNQLDFADLEAIDPKPLNYQPGPQSYNITPSSQTIIIQDPFSIDGTIGGSANVYQWRKDGVAISGATTAIYQVPASQESHTGTYECIVTSTAPGNQGVVVASTSVTITIQIPYEPIPDPNFATVLEMIMPGCINEENMINTRCEEVVNATSLDLGGQNISDLTGLEHFVNLSELAVYNNQLTALPELPATLTKLNCYGNQLTSLPALPEGITEINAYSNVISVLPPLPEGLLRLDVSGNQIGSLPPLPQSLKLLFIGNNPLTEFPGLPSGLTALACQQLNLESLPTLPNGLTYLNCNDNRLTALPDLPSVDGLYCANNRLTSLPALPMLVTLQAEYNFLDFADLEAIDPVPVNFWVTPQKLTLSPAALAIFAGTGFSYDATVSGSANLYQWQKNGVDIPAASSPVFARNFSSMADEGIYRCLVRSTVPGLTAVEIVSSDVYVKVNGIPISAGNAHSLFLTMSDCGGVASSTGLNSSGQLGIGNTTQRTSPTDVVGLTRPVRATAAGYNHSLFVLDDGSVWATGQNTYGQLGTGTTTAATSPVHVTALSDIVAVAAGQYHSLFLKSDGTVWACGVNSNGQLGDGTLTQRNTPVRIPSVSNVSGIDAGALFSLFLLADGTVKACGRNANGQLGDGTTTRRLSPVLIASMTNVVALSGGGNHSHFIKSDGTVWGTGLNSSGQLGDGTTAQKLTPVQIPSLSNVTAVSGGGAHTLFLKGDGTAWACGLNSNAQLGDGSLTTRVTPVQVASLTTNVRAIASGVTHSQFLLTNWTVRACGRNANGQLGDRTTTRRSVPVHVKDVDPCGATGARTHHSPLEIAPQENAELFDVIVLGNPFREKLQFRVNSAVSERVHVEITDVHGHRVCGKESMTNTVVEITDPIAAGMYVLKVRASSGIRTVRVMRMD